MGETPALRFRSGDSILFLVNWGLRRQASTQIGFRLPTSPFRLLGRFAFRKSFHGEFNRAIDQPLGSCFSSSLSTNIGDVILHVFGRPAATVRDEGELWEQKPDLAKNISICPATA